MILDDQFQRSIKPRTRAERRGVKDKTTLEKSRMSQRVGIQARIHQANAPPTSSGLVSCEQTGAGYLSNVDRFHSDTAGEEYLMRQQSIQKKQQITEYKRNQVSE